jgi:hypothetical protein
MGGDGWGEVWRGGEGTYIITSNMIVREAMLV